jgi:hypothetical protein
MTTTVSTHQSRGASASTTHPKTSTTLEKTAKHVTSRRKDISDENAKESKRENENTKHLGGHPKETEPKPHPDWLTRDEVFSG